MFLEQKGRPNRDIEPETIPKIGESATRRSDNRCDHFLKFDPEKIGLAHHRLRLHPAWVQAETHGNANLIPRWKPEANGTPEGAAETDNRRLVLRLVRRDSARHQAEPGSGGTPETNEKASLGIAMPKKNESVG